MTAVDDARAWAAHTSTNCEFEVFPGGHFYLAEQLEPVLRTIVRQTDQWALRALDPVEEPGEAASAR